MRTCVEGLRWVVLGVVWLALSVPVQAQPAARAPAQVWTRGPHGTPVAVPDQSVFAEVVDGGRVHVRVTRSVAGVEQTLLDQTFEGPHWQSAVGEPCHAMGIAFHEIVRVGGHLAVRLEVSVGDTCEGPAPTFTNVRIPTPNAHH